MHLLFFLFKCCFLSSYFFLFFVISFKVLLSISSIFSMVMSLDFSLGFLFDAFGSFFVATTIHFLSIYYLTWKVCFLPKLTFCNRFIQNTSVINDARISNSSNTNCSHYSSVLIHNEEL